MRSPSHTTPTRPRTARSLRTGPTVLLAVALAAILPAGAAAKTYEVNKRGDHGPATCTADDCTLREAVIAATGKPGNDRIELPSRKTYKLTRSETLPAPDPAKGDLDPGNAINEFGNALTIVHPGPGRAKITAAAADDRVFESKGRLKLVKLVLKRGDAQSTDNSGGAAHAAGTLIVVKSRVVRNDAADVGGGLYMAGGLLNVRRTVLKRNEATDGGGIFAGPTVRLLLKKSTVSGNHAAPGSGGGVWVQTANPPTSQIVASTIDGNTAVGRGGGLDAAAAELSVVNTTITKNSAAADGGGIYSHPASHTELNAVTIARNRAASTNTGAKGGGIFADGGGDVVEMRNSLLVKNRIAGGAINECDAPAPVGVDSLGGNLIGSAAGGCNFFDHPQDITAGNPRIGKLKAKGGPTKTIPLRAGSPAINEADGPSPPSRDQRGHQRGTQPDIGAYER